MGHRGYPVESSNSALEIKQCSKTKAYMATPLKRTRMFSGGWDWAWIFDRKVEKLLGVSFFGPITSLMSVSCQFPNASRHQPLDSRFARPPAALSNASGQDATQFHCLRRRVSLGWVGPRRTDTLRAFSWQVWTSWVQSHCHQKPPN